MKRWGSKRCLVLIELEKMQETIPFTIDRSSYGNMDDWLPVEDIDRIKKSLKNLNLLSPSDLIRLFILLIKKEKVYKWKKQILKQREKVPELEPEIELEPASEILLYYSSLFPLQL